jgi:hypothetical protein
VNGLAVSSNHSCPVRWSAPDTPIPRPDSRFRETAETHNPVGSKVEVFYPFHPLCGRQLEVRRRSGTHDGALTLEVPQGFCAEVPRWMTEEQAAGYRLSKEAHVAPRALLSLVELLEASLEEVRF